MQAADFCLTAILLATSALATPALAQVVPANTLPTGGNVVAGQATIGQPSGHAMTITQSSDKAIINWHAFSVGQDASIVVHQPDARSALLNRVTGDARSTIAGSISANGQLFLINPNGIAITRTGKVSAAGFAASSLDIADSDFLHGLYEFTGAGASARVANHGTISIVGRGGYAALIGGQVANSGLIAAPLGRIGLGAGEKATLDFAGDGFLQVAVPTRAIGDGALLDMSGSLSAEGGLVVMTAAQAREAARQAVNLTGVVEARSVSGRNGAILLAGGDGAVAISGMLDASGAKGGSVTVTGADIVLAGATVDVSGETGGGSARIGGDWQGSGDLARAMTTSVDAATTIRADATASGDGGTVVVWSDERTRFAGKISATAPGKGGDAEVSGKAWLAYTGSADLRGTAAFGDLLLDPYDIIISTATDSGHSGFTSNADNSVINVATLVTALELANVTVSTGSGGSQAGDIAVLDGLAWASNATLTLNAAGTIALGAPITARAGGLTLSAGDTLYTSGSGTVDVARFTLAAGDWGQRSPLLPAFAAGDFRITGGTFVRATDGWGTSGDPFRIADIYGLQGMATRLGNHFQLANDVDASGTAFWNGGAGFLPIGTDRSPFTGSLDGDGRTISNLIINRPSQHFVGLFTYTNGATITNLGLAGSITGRDNVGGLVALQNAGSIARSWFSGTVRGEAYVGGLVGYQEDGGSIGQSWSTGTVNGSALYIGGLVGAQNGGGSINESWASSGVSGISAVGGLVGSHEGGGGRITQSWASGPVVATLGTSAGGLLGESAAGTIVTNSYWDTQTTGQATSAGGGTGLTTAQARRATNYAGWDFTTVWYQSSDIRPILRSQAATADSVGKIAISNIYQLQLMGADPTGDYVLSNDIDASLTGASDPAGIWGTRGFVPIGKYDFLGPTFTGTFDGAGHVISRLTSNRSELASLFGYAQGATITNVGLANVNISGSLTIGGLAGYQDGGTIARSWVSGTVIAQGGSVGGIVGHQVSGTIIESGSSADVQGFTNVMIGGLVGYSQSSTISKSWASGSVTGTYDRVGGLVGHAVFGTSISQSWASGTVSGDWFVGGLAGSSDGSSISQSWASGSVSGNRDVGGLVGFQNSGSISQSWASGAVSASSDYGGLVGSRLSGTITASYWDTETTGQATSAGGMGLTTAQARQQTSYAGWDFAADWYHAEDMRPIQRGLAADPVGGVISVSNLYQLQLMGANLSGSYALTNDIDASATDGTNDAGVWGSGGWAPVGTFTGNFDGAGHVISNLRVNRTSLAGVGFFGSTNGATITGVGLANVDVRGRGIVGGLVGSQLGGSINRSWVTGAVGGVDILGGLVGQVNSGTVSQSWANVSVGGSASLGGLVGILSGGGSISQSWASGTVTGAHYYVGGLVGTQTGGTISRSWSNAAVSALDWAAGGLLGFQNGGTIEQSWASGAVSGGAGAIDLGGLVGRRFAGTTSASFWDMTTTGRAASGSGGTGLTTAQFQDTAGFMALAGAAGWDFQTVWAPPLAGFNPVLYSMERVVAIQAPSATTIYGDAPALLAGYYGLRPGEFLRTAATLGGVVATTGVGIHAITAAGGATTYTGASAYRFVTIPGSMTVTPRAITVSANGLSRLYGDGNPALTYVATGLVNGDTLAGALATAATAASGVGTYGIVQGTLVNSNYAITYAGANLTITPRPLTVIADALSRLYGDANPALTYVATGLVNGDTLAGALATTATAASGVGIYGIVQGTLTASPNYMLAYSGENLTVTPRPLTVTADALSRLYGDANSALTYVATGLVNGDTLAGALAATATAASGVGTYGIVQGTLAAGPNYTLAYTGENLTITPRPLTVTADALSRLYGDANPTLTYVATGLVNGDTLAGALATSATTASDVGAYGINQGTLAASPNYTLAYTGESLTVGPRPLVITPEATSRIYGDPNPTSGAATGDNLVNGDTILNVALGTAATTASGVGGHDLWASNASGTGLSNYTITYALLSNGLTVTPRPLTVTADTLSRLYGEANPTLTYTIGGSGLANGDTLSGTLTTPATILSGVGSYAISEGTLTASSNYALSYIGANLIISPRPITVTANPISRLYGNANPILAYAVGGAGLVNGDMLSGMLATGAEATSRVGAYAITLGSLAASPNYQLAFSGADLTVMPRPIVVIADALSRVYGDANPTLTYSVGGLGLVNGDALTGALATDAVAASGIGAYAVTRGTLAANENYALSYAPANLTVTPRPILIAANPVERLYGHPNPEFTAMIGGSGLAPFHADLGAAGLGLRADSDQSSPVGTYSIVLTGRNANYALTFFPATLTVAPIDVARGYGASTTFLDSQEGLLLPSALLHGVLPIPLIDEEYFTRDPRLTGTVTCLVNEPCVLLR